MKKRAFIYLLIYLVILAHNVVPHHHAHIFILNSFKLSSGAVQELHESHSSHHEFSIHGKNLIKRPERKVTEPIICNHFILAQVHDLFFENKEKECNLSYTKSYLRWQDAHRRFAYLRPPPSFFI
ncbi:MAG: hypothetical protein ACRC9Q_08945 [Bacteroidales bacterium]